MSLLLTTTTITVSRVPIDPTRDSYDTKPDPVAIATGVAAHISTPAGTEIQLGGTQERITFLLFCELCDIRHIDQVLDEATGTVYEVLWVQPRSGIELDHIEAGLHLVVGEP